MDFEALIARYWELAYREGKTGESHGTEANEVLFALRQCLLKAPPLPPGRPMFWDAEDPEDNGGPWLSLEDAIEGIGGNQDLDVGDTVTLLQAIEQPTLHVRILSIPGEDSDPHERVGYEVITTGLTPS